MSYKLLLISGVDDDISKAVEWYELKQNGLGARFIDDWVKLCKLYHIKPLCIRKKSKIFPTACSEEFSLSDSL